MNSKTYFKINLKYLSWDNNKSLLYALFSNIYVYY